MDIKTAQLVLSGISALSSAVRLYQAAKEMGRQPTQEELEQATEGPTVEYDSASSLATVIDQQTLQVVLANVNSEKRRLINTLSDPELSFSEKDHVADQVDQAICDALGRIRRYNAGVLPNIPGQDLYELARSHGCN